MPGVQILICAAVQSLLILGRWARMWHFIRARNHGDLEVSLRIKILRRQIYGLIVEPKPYVTCTVLLGVRCYSNIYLIKI
jgi:hypothetical protein